ncbi:MAG TPA: Rrf2 family transcriptional regulator [Phycisphaerae bacterium]|nr:Rrf2 family transcriptional regulator [Phycisphaerae bacterium]
MLFSKTVVHGVYILCHLSRQAPHTVVPAATVAEAMNVPTEQAAKILRALTNAGIVSSARGRRGGYALVRKPDEITLAELVDALGPAAPDEERFGPRSCPVVSGESCCAREGLMQVHARVQQLLGTETLGPVIGWPCTTDTAPFKAGSRSPRRSHSNPSDG